MYPNVITLKGNVMKQGKIIELCNSHKPNSDHIIILFLYFSISNNVIHNLTFKQQTQIFVLC